MSEDHARALAAPDEVIPQAADDIEGRKVFVGNRLPDGETPLARGEALFVGLRPGLA